MYLVYVLLSILTKLIECALPLYFAVDLGCGSGLSGDQFRQSVRHLTGVDLSPEMAKAARDRGCYDQIIVGDAECILQKDGIWDYDFVFACDLFAYIGGKIALLGNCTILLCLDTCLLFGQERRLTRPFCLYL